MKDKFIEYIKAIGITETAYVKKIEEIVDFFSKLCGEEVIDIFVNDYIKDDMRREYESIDLFSENWEFSAINFITEDTYHITKREKCIFLEIKKKNYDYQKATEKSLLSVSMTFENRTRGSFKASKENCDFLRQVILRYLNNF